MRQLNALEKAFVKVVEVGGRLTEGYTLAFAEELVRHHGISGFFRWAKGTQTALNEVNAFFGDEDGHLMSSFASFFNGCDYCAYGHLLAHNIHYFERTQLMFPLDEHDVRDLMMRPDAASLGVITEKLSTASFARKLYLIKREYELRTIEGPVEGPEDKMLVKCNSLYEWINECSIVVRAPAPPLGRISKKKKLVAEYERAREAERKARTASAKAPSDAH